MDRFRWTRARLAQSWRVLRRGRLALAAWAFAHPKAALAAALILFAPTAVAVAALLDPGAPGYVARDTLDHTIARVFQDGLCIHVTNPDGQGGNSTISFTCSHTETFDIEQVAVTDDGKWCFKLPRSATLNRVSASMSADTATIQLYERTEAAPNTGTTGMLAAGLAVTASGTASTTSFTDSAIAANAPVCLGVSASTAAAGDVLRLHVEVTD